MITVRPLATSELGVFVTFEELQRLAEEVHRLAIEAAVAKLGELAETVEAQGREQAEATARAIAGDR